MQTPLLLAINLPGIEILAIIVGAIVVWLWGLITGDQKPGAPRQNPANQPAPPQNRTAQSNAEIERFLQRANQQRQQKQPPPPPDRTAATRAREDEQRRRQTRKPPAPPRQKSTRRREQPVMAEVLPIPGESLPDHVRRGFDTRKFEQRASHLGSVDQAVEQLNEQVQHSFDHQVGHLAQAKRTAGRASDETDSTYGSSPLAAAHPLVAMISNPSNLQAAVILGEIMQPPTHRWD